MSFHPKRFALLAWGLLLTCYLAYTAYYHVSPLTVAQQLAEFLRDNPLGPLLYIAVYAVRPLFFFSATALTVIGGTLYGPWLGVLLVIIGANVSALVAYTLAQTLGATLLDEHVSARIQPYIERMRRNAFETILILRFMFIPYDAVNYTAGLLRIPRRAFLAATIIGSIPGTLSFVLFGASVEESLQTQRPTVNPQLLALSAVLFLVSLAFSWYVRTRERTGTLVEKEADSQEKAQ
ncbi:hypothetical protein ARMA_1393 [Ardenticatena maritima]|uniref:TVP38/TMEM64 family membrane protein n=1 Tax=Ardenticatena maritima TaxID=872965 RepID=A0A0M9UCL5_9CHLR|nr:TVP38/TMEM64 family protein [Ardenticatena maritima]KPL86268.1 hypothetical protein SE16_13010 [Ardenticatena maritima]GAP62970.1 hypothetical protein ARMA_1393 [Ardenticatena maritima]